LIFCSLFSGALEIKKCLVRAIILNNNSHNYDNDDKTIVLPSYQLGMIRLGCNNNNSEISMVYKATKIYFSLTLHVWEELLRGSLPCYPELSGPGIRWARVWTNISCRGAERMV
jgi:hypothetical protein